MFGSNFKIKCAICLADSGWVTYSNADLWWLRHYTTTMHCRMAKFIRKFGPPMTAVPDSPSFPPEGDLS